MSRVLRGVRRENRGTELARSWLGLLCLPNAGAQRAAVACELQIQSAGRLSAFSGKGWQSTAGPRRILIGARPTF